MTTTQQEQNRAAAAFTVILTVAAGAAGLAVAGLILGFDYMLRGEPDQRARLAEEQAARRARRYDDALAWLEADRANRERQRAARREWFNADRDTRGEAPNSGETFGRVMARAWNWSLVKGVGFGRGWRAGREEAQRRRDAGDKNWWKPARQQPQQDTAAPTSDNTQPEPTATPAPKANSEGTQSQPTSPTRNDIIDAEIVPDAEPSQQASSVVVQVVADEPTVDLGIGGYTGRIDNLRDEVDQTLTHRNDNPSPPLSSLR